MFPSLISASIQTTESAVPLFAAPGRFLLTLGMALFLSYLIFVCGALVVSSLSRRRSRGQTRRPLTGAGARRAAVEDAT